MKAIKRSYFCLALFFLLYLQDGARSQVPGSFVFEGLTRSYTVYVPSSYTPGDHLPLLLALHGLTQTGNIMMQFTGFNTYADQYGFIVVYPDGVGNAWNVGFTGGSTANDVGFLSALIDTLHMHYGIDLSRVYSTGFSNGGFMSYRLACELTGRIAAIASVSGTMTDAAWGSCQPSRHIPVMHIHGTSDLVVFYNGGLGNKSVAQVLELWRNFGNCPANAVIVDLPDLVAEGSTVQTQTWAPCDDSAEVVHYKVINGGHTWPGSIGTTGLGNTNRDISASDEIWKFVSRFSLNLPTAVPGIAADAVVCRPNPFSEYTTIGFTLQHAEYVRLEILSLRGGIVETLVDGSLDAGSHQVRVNRGDLPAGISLFRLQTGSTTVVGKLVVL